MASLLLRRSHAPTSGFTVPLQALGYAALVARDIPAQLVASKKQDVTATKKVSQVSSKSSSALVRASRPPSS